MTLVKKDKQRIDTLAKESLSSLDKFTLPFQIIRAAHNFKNALHRESLYDENDESLTHSKKYLMEADNFVFLQEILAFSAHCFDTTPLCLNNSETGDGILFVGHINHAYASECLFSCLSKITLTVREEHLPQLKRFKKPSTQERKMDEYIDDWLDNLFGPDRYKNCVDSLEAEEIANYIRQHFTTTENQRQLMQRMIEMIKPLYDGSLKDSSITWGEAKNEIHKTFPETMIENTIKEIEAMKKQDIVMLFLCDDAIQEQFFEEEEDE